MLIIIISIRGYTTNSSASNNCLEDVKSIGVDVLRHHRGHHL